MRLIDADEAKKKIRPLSPEDETNGCTFGTVKRLMHKLLDEAPTIDAQSSVIEKWISVTERLPENLTSVIVHRKDGGIFMWEYFNTSPTDDCWIDDSMNVYSFYDVTHWMPLPDQPSVSD